MLQVSNQPAAILHQAYELLVKMQKLRLDPMEEVSMQLTNENENLAFFKSRLPRVDHSKKLLT